MQNIDHYLTFAGLTTDPKEIKLGGLKLIDCPDIIQIINRDNQYNGNQRRVITPPLPFAEYQILVEKLRNDDPIFTQLGINIDEKKQLYTNDFRGYKAYLQESKQGNNLSLTPFFFRWLDAHIPEPERRKHTYIVAGSRSGKSELLKCLIHQYIVKGYSSLVVLDPSGKLFNELARFKEFAEFKNAQKLVLFDPYLAINENKYPVINPFEIRFVNPQKLTTQELFILDRASAELTRTIDQIMSDKGAGLTPQMENILKYLVSVIILKGGSFADFMRIFDENNNKDLIEIGENHPNEHIRHFFKHRFLKDKDLNVSITPIKSRVENLASSTLFMRLTTGKSTIDLEHFLDSGKIVFFNLSLGIFGDTLSKNIGKLLIAQLQILSMQRQGKDPKTYKPVHVFIDEMQNYITQSISQILTQSAKYDFFLTLANQYTGQTDGQSAAGKFYAALLGNTGVKIIGRAGADTISDMSTEMNIKKELLQKLKQGNFYVKVAGFDKPAPFTSSRRLLDNSNAMSAEQWEQLKAEQIKKYYREPTNTRGTQGEMQTAPPPPPKDTPKKPQNKTTEQRTEPKQENTQQTGFNPLFDL
jgi:hypothetical protein